MCGIFSYIGDNPQAQDLVLDGLKFLEYRGYDSWGIAAFDAKKRSFVIKRKVGKIKDAKSINLPSSNLAMGHTRWATHGGVTVENAHPHTDCTKKIVIIHNGIIENYAPIKKRLQEKGHIFSSETDTEVAVHLIEEYRKKLPFNQAVKKAFLRFKGLNAFIVMEKDYPGFIAIKNGSPLVIGFGQNENFLASDAAALISHTKKVYFLKDNDFVEVKKNKITLKNLKRKTTLPIKPQHLSWDISQAEKGSYPHFMLKEIHEQPSILKTIIDSDDNQTKIIAKIIETSFGSYLVGCGTAAYACLAGTYIFSKISNFHINWAIGSEFGYHLDFLTKKSLVIALSQSGETMDTLVAIKKAKKKQADIIALVNVLGSTLYRQADYQLLLQAGPEKAVASTKAFTAKITHLLLIASHLAGKPLVGKRLVTIAIKSTKAVLSQSSIDNIRNLARKIKNKHHIYIIGRGLSYPASLETALKIKEISYIHAEGFAAGELKHGVIALVEKGTPCIAFVPHDETYGENLAGAMEMKARGGYIIGISPKSHEVFDYHLKVPDAKEATIIPNVITGQMLAYYLSIQKGLDPDMPRNLAKSVTVK